MLVFENLKNKNKNQISGTILPYQMYNNAQGQMQQQQQQQPQQPQQQYMSMTQSFYPNQ